MALFDNSNVIFYHPLDDATEQTQSQTWTGTAEFTTGKIGSANSAAAGSSMTFGSEDQFDPNVGGHTVAALSATSVLVCYAVTNTGNAEGIVGTISGTSITWGASNAYDTASNVSVAGALVALSSTKALLCYRATSGDPTYLFATVSGAVLTWSSPTTFTSESSGNFYPQGMAILDSSRVIVVSGLGASSLGKSLIGTISGSTVTWGPEDSFEGAIVGSAGGANVAALSSSSVVVVYKTTAGATTDIFSKAGVVSGVNTTWGAKHTQPEPANAMSLAALTSTTLVLVQETGSIGPPGYQVGTVTGLSITWGAFANIWPSGGGGERRVSVAKLSSTTVVVYARNGKAKVGAVSGTTISWGTETTYSSTTANSANSFAVALNSAKAFVAWTKQGNFPGYGVVGTLPFSGDIQAPTPGAYPTVVNDTHLTVALWAQNLTASGSTVTVSRGYSVEMTSSQISLGTAVWTGGIGTVMTAMNDGSGHFLVLDFDNTGGSNWNLRTSVDGAAFTDQGAQDSGSQAVIAVDTAPRLQVADGSGDQQWVDELMMWSGNAQFTGTELDNLYDLANDFADPMDEYTQRFLTTTLQSDPTGLSVTATTDREGNGNGVSPFSREYAAEDSVSFTAPATATGGRAFLEWRNSGGDVVSTSRTLTKTLALSETETFKAFYQFVGNAANNYLIVSN